MPEGSNYLVAIVLLEQEGIRIMPIGGKSIKEIDPDLEIPSEYNSILLDLLLRVLDRSESGNLKKGNKSNSILLVEMDIELMSKDLPILKAEWIRDGDSTLFISKLKDKSIKIWNVCHEKYKGIQLNLL